MKTEITGKPAFAYINVDLESGESIVAEPDAMSSMDADLEVSTTFNGGFFSGLAKKYLGGETLFINTFTNTRSDAKRVTLVQQTPGDLTSIDLDNESFCLQPGAFLACTPGIELQAKWAGFKSFISGEGLFKLLASGTGTLWFGAYGGLVEKQVEGEFIVDTSHLVAYEPQLELNCQLAGGAVSSFFGGEGLVTRIEGNGKIFIQTRSMSGLVSWMNTHVR